MLNRAASSQHPQFRSSCLLFGRGVHHIFCVRFEDVPWLCPKALIQALRGSARERETVPSIGGLRLCFLVGFLSGILLSNFLTPSY